MEQSNYEKLMLITNTIRNSKKYAETKTDLYRLNTNIQKQQDLNVFHPDKNVFNVFEYQQGHPTHIIKGSERRPLVGRPFGIQDRIHSDNLMIERNLNRIVNISGKLMRNVDIPVRENMRRSA